MIISVSFIETDFNYFFLILIIITIFVGIFSGVYFDYYFERNFAFDENVDYAPIGLKENNTLYQIMKQFFAEDEGRKDIQIDSHVIKVLPVWKWLL